MNIKQKLTIWLLLIALIPTTLVSTVAYVSISNEITNKTVEQLESIAIKQQQRIGVFLHQRREETIKESLKYELLNSLDQYYKTKGASGVQTLTDYIRNKKLETPVVAGILVLDVSGKIIASTNLGDEGKVLPAQDYFVPRNQQTAITIREDSRDNVRKLFINTNLYVNNAPAGFLIMVYRLNDVAGTIEDYTGLGSSGETLVAMEDKNDNALSLFALRFDQNAAFKTNLNSLNLFVPGDNIFMDLTDYRDHQVIVATRHIDVTGWSLATKIDRDEALAPISALRNILILISVISSGIIILVAFSIARQFTAPIIALTNKTRLITQGDLTQKIESTSSDEIGVLAATFNQMTAQLSQSYGQLEQKVQEKTAALGQKVKEMERINKFMVGRELKMIDLKNENTKLKAELEKITQPVPLTNSEAPKEI